MSEFILFHGSDHEIERPDFNLGKPTNDYGSGFYCTQDIDLAREWATKTGQEGYVNRYRVDTDDLRLLDLLDGKHNILNWMALLLKNRTFHLNSPIAEDAKRYIIQNFDVDLTGIDIIKGYRADDSYFSYAEDFVTNALSLSQLSRALYLGKLGTQIVLVSKKAFEQITYLGSERVNENIYYLRYAIRDFQARNEYKDFVRTRPNYADDIFVMDILRKEIKNGDPRLQCLVSK